MKIGLLAGLVITVGILGTALLVSTVAAGQQPASSPPGLIGMAPSVPTGGNGVLDTNYDDSWTKNIPEMIAGLRVLEITTPKSRACSFVPLITVQVSQKSVDEFLGHADVGSALRDIHAIPGVPSTISIGFTNSSATADMRAGETAAWNAYKIANGCGGPWTDTEVGNDAGGRGWAIFQNTDAGLYTDDNAQSVNITTPSGIGTGQNAWSAALNNTLTNGSSPYNWLQTGMQLQAGNTFIGWTDAAHNFEPVSYGTDVPYYANTPYFFSNTYTSGVWFVCAGNNTNSDYKCIQSGSTGGTTIVSSVKTSVWFENANSNSGWASGFPSSMSPYTARIYRNGIGQNWSGENRWTIHNCGAGTYPVSGAMGSTSLRNGATATWTMSGIPLYCP